MSGDLNGHLRLLENNGDTIVQIDSNGGGNSFQTVATLDNLTGLNVGDFFTNNVNLELPIIIIII